VFVADDSLCLVSGGIGSEETSSFASSIRSNQHCKHCSLGRPQLYTHIFFCFILCSQELSLVIVVSFGMENSGIEMPFSTGAEIAFIYPCF